MINFSKELKDPAFTQTSYHVGAWVYRTVKSEEDDLKEALKYAQTSMKILDDRGDRINILMKRRDDDNFCDKRKCALNQLMGDIYFDMDNFETAKKHYFKASKYDGLEKDPELKHTVLNALREVTESSEERLKISNDMLQCSKKCDNEIRKGYNETESEFYICMDKLALLESVSIEEIREYMVNLYQIIHKKFAKENIVVIGKKVVITCELITRIYNSMHIRFFSVQNY